MDRNQVQVLILLITEIKQSQMKPTTRCKTATLRPLSMVQQRSINIHKYQLKQPKVTNIKNFHNYSN